MTPARRDLSKESSRDGFVRATARLLQRQGYGATAISEIVERSGAPKGSLYFHFPDGKQQLAVEAMTHAGGQLCDAIAAIVGSGEERLGESLSRLADALAAGLAGSGYRDGCPIATVTLELSSSSEAVRASADAVFASWLKVLEQRLIAEGMTAQQAERRSLLVLSALEGALILARAREDVGPLTAVRDELAALAG